MVWFKVDDGLAFHAKTVRAGNAAMGLWIRAGTWAAQHLTDGFLPAHMVAALGTKGQAAALVAAGFWEQDDDGYRFHDWNDHQPTSDEVEEARSARSEAGRIAGLASGRARTKRERAPNEPRTNRSPPVEPTLNDSRTKTNPVPSRPVTTTAPTVLPAAPSPVDESWHGQTKTQRSKRITDAYAAAEPMCKWPAVNAIVLRAIGAAKWSDAEIRDGLLRLAKDGRGVTVETLRVELNGLPPARAAPRESTTDQRVRAGLDLAARYQAEEDAHDQIRGRPAAITGGGDGPADHR